MTGGLFGGIIVHPEEREPGVRDVLALTHLYDDVPTVNGHTAFRPVVARAGERVRVRVVNTDNGPQNVWTSAPFLLRAVDGFDVNEPTEVTDRSVGIPAGGGPTWRCGCRPTAPPCASQLLGDVGLTHRPAGQRVPEREAARGRARPARLRLAGDVGFDPAQPDRKFDYSVGRRPGFLDGKPGLWWSVNGKLYPDMPMFVVREGDVVTGARSPTTAVRRTRCTCTATTRWCCPATAQGER